MALPFLCGVKWRNCSTDVHLYPMSFRKQFTDVGTSPRRPIRVKTGTEKLWDVWLLSQAAIWLPSGRKGQSEEKKEKIKVQRYNYQLNLGSSTFNPDEKLNCL